MIRTIDTDLSLE